MAEDDDHGRGGSGRPRGLTSQQAAERLSRDGPNALPESPPTPWWARVGRQLRSSIIYILLFALAFDLVVWLSEGRPGWPFESVAIATILVWDLEAILGVRGMSMSIKE
ncbi:MAG: cation-transporting P-type ATPase, partial [Actinomycetota bacterium]